MNYKYFNNKKVLVIVPHQDDEICLTGGLLSSINNENTKIVYVTNGNFIYSAKTRYKEAIKSCLNLGIKKENIIFLGYSDSSYDYKNHMYTTDGIWMDKYNNTKTFGIKGINEYSFIKKGIHNDFTKENVINDLYEIIKENLPDIIICNDLDFHPDHIMTSLCFEKALGKVLKNSNNYYPLVLKGFCYENSYLGPNDFNQKEVKNMQFLYDENGNLINNKYYKINEGINIELNKVSYTRNLLVNKQYKSILKHKSQLLVSRSFSIINPNVVYFIRNTKNLINEARISVSSGNKEYLNDFVLCDSNYILNGNIESIKYNKGIWIPDNDDSKKEVIIDFDTKKYVKILNIYIDNIKQILVNIDDNEQLIDVSDNIISICIEKEISKIKIRILNSNNQSGFSEIEILDSIFKDDNNNTITTNEFYSILFNKFLNSLITFIQRIERKLFIKKNK